MGNASEIWKHVQWIFKSDYVRNVGKLASGRTLAAALPFLAAPILGRLYTPTEYGLLAAYMAIPGLLVVLATLQLHQGIIAERSERRALMLVEICTWVSILIGGLVLCIATVIYFLFDNHQTYGSIRAWFFLLPIIVVGGATGAAFGMLINRAGRYRELAILPVVSVGVSLSLSLALGFSGWGAQGLLTAYCVSQLVSFLILWRVYRSIAHSASLTSPRKLFATAIKHRGFVYFTLPSGLLSTLNLNMPTYVFAAAGLAPILGSYSRASRLVGAPLTLLGQSIGTVFRQRGSEDYRKYGSCRPILTKTALLLFSAGLMPMAVVTLYGDYLLVAFLGPNWASAGEIAQILAPMLLIRMVVSPLASIFQFTGRQFNEFCIQIFGTVLLIAVLAIWSGLKLDSMIIVSGYAVVYSLFYVVLFVFAWRYALRR